jgi:hypothetical protein
MTVSKVFIVVAVVLFALATFGVAPFGLNAIPCGLAFFAAAQLV